MGADSDSGADVRAGAGSCQEGEDGAIEGSYRREEGDSTGLMACEALPVADRAQQSREGTVQTVEENHGIAVIRIAREAAPDAMRYLAGLARGLEDAPHSVRVEAAKTVLRTSGAEYFAEQAAKTAAAGAKTVLEMSADELLQAAKFARARLEAVPGLLTVDGTTDSQSGAQAPQAIDPIGASTRASADCAQTVPNAPDQPLPEEASPPAERPESDAWSLD